MGEMERHANYLTKLTILLGRTQNEETCHCLKHCSPFRPGHLLTYLTIPVELSQWKNARSIKVTEIPIWRCQQKYYNLDLILLHLNLILHYQNPCFLSERMWSTLALTSWYSFSFQIVPITGVCYYSQLYVINFHQAFLL